MGGSTLRSKVLLCGILFPLAYDEAVMFLVMALAPVAWFVLQIEYQPPMVANFAVVQSGSLAVWTLADQLSGQRVVADDR